MTDEQVLHFAQKALMAVEELDRTVMPRRPAYSRRVEKAISDARQALFKLVGTSDAVIQPPQSQDALV